MQNTDYQDIQAFFPENIPVKKERVAIFATYNKDGIIADYVLYYLKELRKVVDVIVLIGDNGLYGDELHKVERLVTYALFARHNEYDFGSYKRGYFWADEHHLLDNAQELIFCNDSCYGPIFPFAEMFGKMASERCDFWSMLKSEQISCHAQTFFCVFSRKVFTSDVFRSLVHQFEHQDSFMDYVLKYEIGLSSKLLESGFRIGSYMDAVLQNDTDHEDFFKGDNPTFYPLTLFSYRMPLLKRKTFTAYYGEVLKESALQLLNQMDALYPEIGHIIKNDILNCYKSEKFIDFPDWVKQVIELCDKETVANVLLAHNKHNMEKVDELQQQQENNQIEFEQQIDRLNHKIAKLQTLNKEQITQILDLQSQNNYYQIQIAQLSKKLDHRSVRFTLKIESLLDKINRKFSLGKYRKRKSAMVSVIDVEGSMKEEPMAQISYDAWYEDNQDYSSLITNVKAIAFYLPQFHAFKENDEWWGKGFTEWSNTKKSKPRFLSHYQPREPHEDIGYYNLLDWTVLQKQAQLARQHGIYGFCFYRYWFAGKELMEKPLELLLSHPEIDINYCLCWANENWTRKWDGDNSSVLIGQTYENDSVEYIADLKKYLDDPRYIRVDNKPVIIIYRPSLLPNPALTFRRWREWARENGVGEILIWIQRGVATIGKSEMVDGADAEIEFPPSGTAEFDHYDITRVGASRETGNLIGYRKLVRNVLGGRSFADQCKHKVYRGVTLGWDNSPRRESGFWATWGFSLVDYYRWLRYVVQDTRSRHSVEDRFFFINAWNEWAEGTYLEPDKRFGYSSINVTARAIFDLPLNAHIDGYDLTEDLESEKLKVENLIGRNLPLFPYSMYSMYHKQVGQLPAEIWDDCNRHENVVSELKKVRRRFLTDQQRTMEQFGLKRVLLESLPLNVTSASTHKVAVQLHLFYEDMIPFVSKYFSNIIVPFDLFVSVPETNECSLKQIEQSLSTITHVKKVVVRTCPNRGRDIAPLICTFGRELLNYDFIAHFHTKKSLHTASHHDWADFIFSHLVGSEQMVKRILDMLSDKVGMVAPPDYLMMPEQPSGWGSNIEYAQHVLDQCHVDINLEEQFPVIEFPQGSMFWARTDFLKKMLSAPIKFSDFPEEPIGVDGTIAHALERLFYVWGLGTGLGVRQVFLPGEEQLMRIQR